MAEKVQIIIEGKDEATPVLKKVSKGLNDVDKAAQQTTKAAGNLGGLGRALQGAGGQASAFASMMGAAVPVGIAATGAAILKTSVDLGNLGQQIKKQRDYFEAYSGGAQQAAVNLDAMRQAIGGAATESEMMVAAQKYLSMGLATNAQQLGNVSRMAVMLGGSTRTATESMDEFAIMLANRSIERLDTFGISSAKVRARVEELKGSVKGISDEAAFMQAVMEQGTAAMQKLEAQGITPAATASQQLETSLKGLKERAAELLATPVGDFERWAATGVQSLTRALDQLSNDTLVRTRAELESINGALANPGWLTYTTDAEVAAGILEEMRQKQARLTAQIHTLTGTAEEMQRWGAISGLAGRTAAAGLDEATLAAQETARAFDALAAGRYAEVGARQFRAQTRAAQTNVARSNWLESYYANVGRPQTQDQRTAAAQARGAYLTQYGQNYLAGMAEASEEAGKKLQTELDQAYTNSVETFKGKIEEAMNYARDLQPGGYKDPFSLAPGANGPAEGVYRAMDVLKLGDASPWASQFKDTSRAALEQGVKDFQAGLMSDAAQALVNVPQLIDQVKLQELANKSREAFAQKIAAAAGVNVGTSAKVLNGLLGVDAAMAKNDKGSSPLTTAVGTISTAAITAWEGKIPDFQVAGKKLIEEGLVQGMKDAQGAVVTTAEQILTAMYNAMIERLNGMKNGGGGGGKPPPPPPTPPPTGPGGTPLPKTAPARVAPATVYNTYSAPLGGDMSGLARLIGQEVAAAMAEQPVNVNMDGERVGQAIRKGLQKRGAGGMGW